MQPNIKWCSVAYRGVSQCDDDDDGFFLACYLSQIAFWGKVIHFTPVHFVSGDHLSHTDSTCPQWPSELRRLWPIVPRLVACELISLLGSHTNAWTAQSARSDFVGSRVYACLGIACYLHVWHTGRGLLRATAVTRGGTDTE